ncbi:aldo/keto reductase [Methylopila turkensis]|uniref:NADP-dependent oxidoreductase domain-containing protein n=1 Tax=Methylopila turkensis TaxID=1437816 RepID=A0A9W6JMF6_9HYPH|nr:aldo/keto reductase [Methylopila turkensis]GLK78379.1 hypothetical protein GCM10008174_01200 [Methylopila turkensis]
MRHSTFGPDRRPVPVIGQGTWRLDDDARAMVLEALRAGLDAGMTHVDTAEMYGEAEPLAAEAIAGRRDEVFLVSKVLPQNAAKARVLEACERSLRRLKTDRLDCYLLHWRGATPLEDTIDAFETLKRQGKIVSWGVSNFDVDDLEEALGIADAGAIACNQVLYHLEERAIEHAVLPWCEAHDVTVVAYSPFGSGAFPDPRSRSGAVLAEVAAEAGASPRQAALAALTRRPSVIAIPKAARKAHALDNAAAGDLELTDGQLARIDAAFPRGPKPRHLPMI